MKLSELTKGQSGRVLSIKVVPQLRRRLLDMGVLVGEMVKIEGIAPFGDPVEVSVKHYRLSLRKDEIEGIEVEKIV